MLVVARVTQFTERAVTPLEISGSQVIKHQGALGQVSFSQSIFDAGLLRQQPVHSLIELILGEGVEMK
jgi:hypothetical protein